MSAESLCDRIGELEVIRAVVDDFYDRLVTGEELGQFFEGSDLELLRRTQTGRRERVNDSAEAAAEDVTHSHPFKCLWR